MNPSSEVYRVTIWDKQANNPYYVLDYREMQDAQEVARNMKKYYIDDRGIQAEDVYEVRLQKVQGENNG
jgi:DNA-binding protein Fis